MPNNTGANSLESGELVNENIRALAQLTQLVAGLTPHQYQQSFGLKGQHSAGKHVRHIIDHYECFLRGRTTTTNSPERIDYENRPREASLETNPPVACGRITTVSHSLQQLRDDRQQNPVLLDYSTATGPVRIDSSVGRELIFLFSHTVHHMAIIGLLAEQLGIAPSSDFGVHPSTLRHWQREENRLMKTG